MKNISKILKYSIRNYKMLYLVEGILLILTLLGGIVKSNTFFGQIISSISIASLSIVVIIINTVAQIVLFYKQIRKEYGSLLFLMPIKGYEFIIAKIMEVILVYLAIVLINIISVVLMYGTKNLLFNYNFEAIYGLSSYVIWVIVLMLIIAIMTTYIFRGSIRVITIIGIETVGMGIYHWIVSIITDILPYINIVSSAGNRFNLVEISVNVLAIIALAVFATKRIDESLDIC